MSTILLINKMLHINYIILNYDIQSMLDIFDKCNNLLIILKLISIILMIQYTIT